MLQMKYNIGKIDKTIIRGWCFDENNINIPTILELYIDNKKVKETKANINRQDLYDKNIHPTGIAGFEFNLQNIEINNNNKIEIKIYNVDYILNQDKAYHDFFNQNITDNTFEKKELCIVHIGMHKTGSSSIQHNLNQTQNKNFSYFNLGSENHSIPLYSMFSKFRNTYHIHQNANRTKEDVKNFNINIDKMFKKHLEENKKYHTFVISGEDISVLSFEELMIFQKYLLAYFKKIQIVAYIRAPFSYTSSAVQELIKNDRHDLLLLTQSSFPQYKKQFEKFDLVFGIENVKLNYFDRDSLKNNDITTDFLYQNKLEVVEDNFFSANESMTLEAISLIYIFNKYKNQIIEGVRDTKKELKLKNTLSKIGDKKFLLSKELLQPITNKYIEEIIWIEKRMGIKILDSNVYNSIEVISSEEDLYKVAKNAIFDLNTIVGKIEDNKIIAENSLEYIIILIKKIYLKTN